MIKSLTRVEMAEIADADGSDPEARLLAVARWEQLDARVDDTRLPSPESAPTDAQLERYTRAAARRGSDYGSAASARSLHVARAAGVYPLCTTPT